MEEGEEGGGVREEGDDDSVAAVEGGEGAGAVTVMELLALGLKSLVEVDAEGGLGERKCE